MRNPRRSLSESKSSRGLIALRRVGNEERRRTSAAAHARTTALAIDPPEDLPEQIDRAIDRAARGQPSRPRSRMLRRAMVAVFVGVIVEGIIRVVPEATRPFPAGDARIAGEVSRPKREEKDRFRRNEAGSWMPGAVPTANLMSDLERALLEARGDCEKRVIALFRNAAPAKAP